MNNDTDYTSTLVLAIVISLALVLIGAVTYNHYKWKHELAAKIKISENLGKNTSIIAPVIEGMFK